MTRSRSFMSRAGAGYDDRQMPEIPGAVFVTSSRPPTIDIRPWPKLRIGGDGREPVVEVFLPPGGPPVIATGGPIHKICTVLARVDRPRMLPGSKPSRPLSEIPPCLGQAWDVLSNRADQITTPVHPPAEAPSEHQPNSGRDDSPEVPAVHPMGFPGFTAK